MLGDNIKKIRESRGLSINAVAKESNISAGYLSDIEKNNKLNPSNEILESISKSLNVTVSDLYKEDRKPDEIDQMEEDFKILYKKMKKISPSDREKIMKMIEIFESEND